MTDFDLAAELDNITDEELGTKLHEKGEYPMVVVSSEAAQTSGKNPCLRTAFEVTDGPYRSHRFTKDIIMSTKSAAAQGFFWRQVGKLGVSTEYVRATGQTKMSQIALLIIGAQVLVKVDHREWPENSGDFREDLNLIRAIGENPNISGTGSSAPAAATLPDLPEEEEEEEAPSLPTAEVVSDGSTEDPWAVTSSS